MEPPTSVQEAAGAGFDTQPIVAGDDDIEGSPASSNTPPREELLHHTSPKVLLEVEIDSQTKLQQPS